MIVVRHVPGFSFRLEDEIREMVRLREGMSDDGLSPNAVDRALATLKLFKRYCESSAVDDVIATATSAVRDAANGPAFVSLVRDEIGLDLRVLSGDEEATYGVLGVLNNIPMQSGFVLDIGGGSAQLSEVRDRRFLRGAALPLGALRLSEQFAKTDPLSDEDRRAIENEIEQRLDEIPWLKAGKDVKLAGLGGTIRNLGYVDIARRGLPLHTVHGLRVTRKSLTRIIKEFTSIRLDARQSVSGLNADRADIIVPGLLVLRGVMRRLGVKDVAVSTYGLREGLFLERFWSHLPYPVIPDVRRFGVLNLARNYGYDKAHANHVRFLALRLYDQMSPLHGYGNEARQLLDAAALLHDIGTVIAYKGHHRHSAALIENNGLPGFSPREMAIVMLLTLYHRKGNPTAGDYRGLLGKGDDEMIRRLTSILRLAEFLERGRNAIVSDVVVTWTSTELEVTLVAEEHPAVELWDAERKAAPLLESVFGRSVVLSSLASVETPSILGVDPAVGPGAVLGSGNSTSRADGAHQADDAEDEPEALNDEG